MIHVICTHCQAALDIDDGFAGGVCRCQHCGTIQTVPKKSKRDAGPARSRTFFKLPGANRSAGSDKPLADAVTTGSGMPSKRLRKKTVAVIVPAPKTSKPRRMWFAAAGAAIVIVIAMVWFVRH